MAIAMKQYIRDEVSKTIATMQGIAADEGLIAEVERVVAACCAALRAGNKILFAGNGGSAADAQHLAAEFTGRYLKERRALPALALHTNTSSLTAIGNDYGFDFVFARQLEALGKEGDVLLGISTSGNSRNVLRAMEVAKSKSIYTIALTGSSGKMKDIADCAICIPSEETPRIQECHILTGHIICEIAEEMLLDPSES